MKISELTPQPKNPRKITSAKLDKLKETLNEFGDLSGIVFNRATGHLVGGHQRTKHLKPESEVILTTRYSKPTKRGTTALGHVIMNGERFAFREVEWSVSKEKAANIAANKGAGEWDLPQLGEWLKELELDNDIDATLTLFDMDEIADLTGITVKEHQRKGKSDMEDEELEPPKTKHGQLYEMGGTQMRCARGELYFCDQVLAKWERYSGYSARLIEEPKLKKAAKQSIRSHAENNQAS